MIQKAEFLTSNTDYRECPPGNKPEVAFIGRSNVGKSSLINMLTQNRKLAKTSGTPGKTQLINHFEINNRWYMVDLPGYGFAKAPKSLRSSWKKMIEGYLTNRENLLATFVLIDSRLEPQKIDIDFIHWCGHNGVPVVLVFTKADKLPKDQVQGKVDKFISAMEELFEEAPEYFITSAEKKVGKEELTAFIEENIEEFYHEN